MTWCGGASRVLRDSTPAFCSQKLLRRYFKRVLLDPLLTLLLNAGEGQPLGSTSPYQKVAGHAAAPSHSSLQINQAFSQEEMQHLKLPDCHPVSRELLNTADRAHLHGSDPGSSNYLLHNEIMAAHNKIMTASQEGPAGLLNSQEATTHKTDPRPMPVEDPDHVSDGYVDNLPAGNHQVMPLPAMPGVCSKQLRLRLAVICSTKLGTQIHSPPTLDTLGLSYRHLSGAQEAAYVMADECMMIAATASANSADMLPERRQAEGSPVSMVFMVRMVKNLSSGSWTPIVTLRHAFTRPVNSLATFR